MRRNGCAVCQASYSKYGRRRLIFTDRGILWVCSGVCLREIEQKETVIIGDFRRKIPVENLDWIERAMGVEL